METTTNIKARNNADAVIVTGDVRLFLGSESRQLDASGHRAAPEQWYWEPIDYDGDVLWSDGFGSRSDAYQSACRELDLRCGG